MSAAELRRAAETLRDTAERVTRHAPAPWVRGGTEDCGCCPGPLLVDGDGEAIIEAWQISRDEATYIATMHPGVALALAKVLDASATELPNDTYPRQGSPLRDLVRLINGEHDAK